MTTGFRFYIELGLGDQEPLLWVAHMRRAAVRGEETNRTPAWDAIRTIGLIDDIYAAAGLPPRP